MCGVAPDRQCVGIDMIGNQAQTGRSARRYRAERRSPATPTRSGRSACSSAGLVTVIRCPDVHAVHPQIAPGTLAAPH